MKTPDTFNRNDLSPFNSIDGLVNRILMCAYCIAVDIPRFKMRATHRAGIGLGVKPPVSGIRIFGPAFIAHFKFRHGGVRAIIGEFFYNAEPGAAIGAVGKRIQVTPVVWIKDVCQAIRACGNIRQNKGGFFSFVITGSDFKHRKSCRVQP